VVRIPETKKFAGFVLFEIDPEQTSTAEAGCILVPAYWKNGHRVFAKLRRAHHRLVPRPRKAGLACEGTLREHVWLRDHWGSTRFYGTLAAGYASKAGSGRQG